MTATTEVKDQVQQYLEHEIERKLAEAAGIAEKAAAAGRGMEPEEETKGNALLAEVAELKERVAEIKKTRAFRDRMNDLSGPTIPTIEEAKDTSSLAAAFVGSEGYQAAKASGFKTGFKTGPVELPWNGKATITTVASPIVTIDTQPSVVGLPFWPLRVADLFLQGTTDSNTVRIITETSETNAAAGVTETGEKLESSIVAANVDFTVGKLATVLNIADEMLEDVAQIESFLNGRLQNFVLRKKDSELLNGSGAPSIKGILQFSSIQSGSALSLDVDSAIDAIFRAMTAVRVTGLYEPDGIVINPTDWAGIRLMKDDAKQYYGGGPFTGAYGNGGGIAPDMLWNLPVAVTTAIAQGTALVGAFKTAAQIYNKRGLTVEATNSHDTNFAHDITTLRAEERLALAVWREQAFYKLTGVDQLLGS